MPSRTKSGLFASQESVHHVLEHLSTMPPVVHESGVMNNLPINSAYTWIS